MVVDNGEDVLLNLKNPTQRVRDPDSNNALVIEFNKEEDLEIEIPKVHSKTDAKNFVVCLDLKNLEGASLRIDVELLGDESNLKEVREKEKHKRAKSKHDCEKQLNDIYPQASLQYSFNEREHLKVDGDQVKRSKYTKDDLFEQKPGGLRDGKCSDWPVGQDDQRHPH